VMKAEEVETFPVHPQVSGSPGESHPRAPTERSV